MDLTAIGNVTLRDIFCNVSQLLSSTEKLEIKDPAKTVIKNSVPDWVQPNNKELTTKKAYQYGLPSIEELPVYLEDQTDYRNLDALNWSTLKRFLDDPRWFALNPDYQYEETEAMKLGSMVHCLILEKQEFSKRYAEFSPPVNEKTGEPYKSGKAYEIAKEEFEKSGKIACTEKQLVTCLEIEKSLADYNLKRMLSRPEPNKYSSERLAMFEFPIYDAKQGLKGKIDCYQESCGLIDFKTSSTPISDTFGKDLFQYKIKSMGYIYQLAFYAKIIRDKTGFVVPCQIIAAETSAPYRCGLYEFSNDTIEEAILKIENEFLPLYKDYRNGEQVTNYYSALL